MIDSDRQGPSSRPRVLIVDDHPIYREGLANILKQWHGIDVVAVVGDAATALEHIRQLQPDVVLLDLHLPDQSGMEVLRALDSETDTRAVVLSAFGDNATVYDAFSSGARGFLIKSSDAAEIAATVVAVARGESVIPAAFQTGLVQEIRTRSRLTERPVLSEREVEVLRLAAEGRSDAQIATALSLSLATVKSHLRHVYEKLDVPDRASAVASAMRRGLLS